MNIYPKRLVTGEDIGKVLFTPFEQGVLYRLNVKETLFQDLACTVPVTAVNDPVRAIKPWASYQPLHDPTLYLIQGIPAVYLGENAGIGQTADRTDADRAIYEGDYEQYTSFTGFQGAMISGTIAGSWQTLSTKMPWMGKSNVNIDAQCLGMFLTTNRSGSPYYYYATTVNGSNSIGLGSTTTPNYTYAPNNRMIFGGVTSWSVIGTQRSGMVNTNVGGNYGPGSLTSRNKAVIDMGGASAEWNTMVYFGLFSTDTYSPNQPTRLAFPAVMHRIQGVAGEWIY